MRDSGAFTNDGNTVFSDTIESTHPTLGDLVSYGWVEGHGNARFTSLGARVRNNIGSTFWGEVRTNAHSIVSVGVPTGVAAGSPGTHTYVFDIDGSAIFDYDPNALQSLYDSGQTLPVSTLVTASVQINKYVDDGNGNPSGFVVPGGGVPAGVLIGVSELPAYGPGTVGTGGPHNIVIDNRRVTMDVPIIYGETFGLNISFTVRTWTDSTFYGGTTYDGIFLNEIDAQFNNTAELIAIVDSANPSVTVVGQNFDYTPLVSAVVPAPVPIPGALWLLLSGFVSLRLFTNRNNGPKTSSQ